MGKPGRTPQAEGSTGGATACCNCADGKKIHAAMDCAISRAFSGEISVETRRRPKSRAVPAPRPVRRLPSVTVRSAERIAGNSAATEKCAV